MHTDQQLDDELLLHIQTKIAYTYRDLKKMRYYKRVDPFSLRYRVEAILMGYYDLTNDENRILGHVTERMYLTELQMSRFIKYSTSIFLVMSQAMKHMLENSTERWRKLFSSKDSWLFNFYTDEDGPLETRWSRMNGLKSDLLKRGNLLVQSNRSYTELKLNQMDVWDSKNFFNQKIREFILT